MKHFSLLISLCLISLTTIAQPENFLDYRVQTFGGIDVTIGDIVGENEVPVLVFVCNESPYGMFMLEDLSNEFKECLKDGSDKRKFKLISIHPKNIPTDPIYEREREEGWMHDKYLDQHLDFGTDQDYATAFFLVAGKRLVFSQFGFIEGPTATLPHILGAIAYHDARVRFYDESGYYHLENEPYFFRTVDPAVQHFIVKDRDHLGNLLAVWYSKDIYANEKHGEETVYYPSGKIQKSATYENGLVTGPVYSWYENGQLESRKITKDNRLIEVAELYATDGQPLDPGTVSNGNGIEYRYKNDKKVLEIEFRDGLVHGTVRYFDQYGKVEKTEEYKEGELVSDDE